MFDLFLSPEKVQTKLLRKLKARFPDGIPWYDPDFTCLSDMHECARTLIAVNELEYQLRDGGWGQFLVECFGNWRLILSLVERGYREMGSSPGLQAIETLRELCAANEDECFRLFSGDSATDDQRSDFLAAGYSARFDWERELWSIAHYKKRLTWISQNKQVLLREARQ